MLVFFQLGQVKLGVIGSEKGLQNFQIHIFKNDTPLWELFFGPPCNISGIQNVEKNFEISKRRNLSFLKFLSNVA